MVAVDDFKFEVYPFVEDLVEEVPRERLGGWPRQERREGARPHADTPCSIRNKICADDLESVETRNAVH